MMGSFAKQKGKRGEREAVKVLQPAIDEVWKWLYGVEECWDSKFEDREGKGGMSDQQWDMRPQLFRNQNQSFEGGYDIDGLAWMALEIKRCETLNLNKWWEQTMRQEGAGQTGVLMYRQSRKPWRIQMMGRIVYDNQSMEYVNTRVDITLEDFLSWFKSRLLVEINRGVVRQKRIDSKM